MNSNESLILHSDFPHRAREIEVQRATAFTGGKNHEKYLLCVRQIFTSGEGKTQNARVGRLVYRRDASGNFLSNWRKLKELDFPVIDTIRHGKNITDVFMSDLTADGSVLVGRGLGDAFNWQSPDDLDFLKLFYTKSSLEMIRPLESELPFVITEVGKIVSKANSMQVLLPEDAFVLRISPDSSWKIIMLDIEYVEFYENLTPDEIIELKSRNSLIADDFLITLQEIFSKIKFIKTKNIFG